MFFRVKIELNCNCKLQRIVDAFCIYWCTDGKKDENLPKTLIFILKYCYYSFDNTMVMLFK